VNFTTVEVQCMDAIETSD